MAPPSFALDRAHFAHAFQFPLQFRDPFLHPAAIHFELRFARPARANSARLPRKVRPHSRQTREQILQLREFDLQPPFPTARALRKDVENELRAIQHFARKKIFQIAALRGRKLVIENDRRDLLIAGTNP